MTGKKYYLCLVFLAVLGALLAVSFLGSMSFHIHAFEFVLALQIFEEGLTEINLPPLGSINANTHESPLKISITLTNIDLQGIKDLLELDLSDGKDSELIAGFRQEIEKIIKQYVVRLILLAAMGAAVGVSLLQPKRRVTYLIGMLIGALLMGGSLYRTYHTYDINQFENPEFRGVLEVAPWMIDFTQEAIIRVDELGKKLQIVAENLFQVYQTLDLLDFREPLDSNLRVLHISDIHNNPAAFDFVKQVAASFEADFIINTGDETDFGTPLENIIFQQIADLKIPYVFLGGNHDSPETLRAIAEIENVILLDDSYVQLGGLTIAGFTDPAARSTEITPMNGEEIAANLAAIKAFFAEKQIQPHIIAVHNHQLAAQLAGFVPLVMHGHDHRVAIVEKAGSVILDAGTSGAAGIRGLQTVQETPYSVLLLYFQVVGEQITLTAVDVFKVFNLRSGFTLERTVLNKDLSAPKAILPQEKQKAEKDD